MKVHIHYFGMLSEITGASSEVVEIGNGKISDLIGTLVVKYPPLKDKPFSIAQNATTAQGEDELTGGDIALLPPFSGG